MAKREDEWTPLKTSPDNGVVSAWRKEGNELVSAEVTVERNGKILGYIKGTGPRVSGTLTVKDLDNLDDAFEEVDALLAAVTNKLPKRLHQTEETREEVEALAT